MLTEIESKLSATIELTQWVGSILTASTHRVASNIVASDAMLLAAVTSLVSVLGALLCYNKFVSVKANPMDKATNYINTPGIATKTINTDEEEDMFLPCINMVPTDNIESDSDIDADDADIGSEEEDDGDWNEEDYNQQFSVVKPTTTTRRSAPKKEIRSTTASRSKSTKNGTKKETLSQMRKRVAREMKESEERRRQPSATKAVRSAPSKKSATKAVRSVPSKKPIRKETVREMKARVAREFAAKLKK